MRDLNIRPHHLLLCLCAGSAVLPGQDPVTAQRLDQGRWRPVPVETVSRLSQEDPLVPKGRTRYGGWRGPRATPTGFFHTEKIKGRWWLIDPDGYRFITVGLCSVTRRGVNRDMTVADQRFGGAEEWAGETARLLKQHHFNSLGCWSEAELFAEDDRRLPYFPRWNFMSTYKNKRDPKFGPRGYPNLCMPLFDEAFEPFCMARAEGLVTTKDDPWLVGHFSDNELPFRPNLLDLYLELPDEDSGHRAAAEWLKEKRGGSGRPEAAPIAQDEQDGFLEYAAARYYSIVARAIKAHDPNHLFVGSRIHGRTIREPVFRGARFTDVVSINYYHRWSVEPERLSRWVAASGRPFIISEWYAMKLNSPDTKLRGAGGQ